MAGGPEPRPRVAVVLFNLGGPDGPEAVRPFLANLFGDPAIVGLPWPLRRPLARLLAARRAPTARAMYAQLGGGSPILANTEAQARALQSALADLGEARVFPCMRYWQPASATVAGRVAAFAPDEVVLLPLYPQFSSTTTASSLVDWRRASRRARIVARERAVCCYPAAGGFVAALARLTSPGWEQAKAVGRPRLLVSAHGLPKRVVERGDPYQDQVEETAAALAASLGLAPDDWRVCYQSRVGPLAWIGPATDDELRRAGAEGRPVVVVTVAFVSEHVETLVELDILYRRVAEAAGVPLYLRVPTVGTAPEFIGALARLVRNALAAPGPLSSSDGRRCRAGRRCPLAGVGP